MLEKSLMMPHTKPMPIFRPACLLLPLALLATAVSSPAQEKAVHISPAGGPPSSIPSGEMWHDFAPKDIRDLRFYSSTGGFSFQVGEFGYDWHPDEETNKPNSVAEAISATAAVLAELRHAEMVKARVDSSPDHPKQFRVIRLTLIYPAFAPATGK